MERNLCKFLSKLGIYTLDFHTEKLNNLVIHDEWELREKENRNLIVKTLFTSMYFSRIEWDLQRYRAFDVIRGFTESKDSTILEKMKKFQCEFRISEKNFKISSLNFNFY